MLTFSLDLSQPSVTKISLKITYLKFSSIICAMLRGGHCMSLLPDTQNCGLRMRREWRERFPRHRIQRKPPVSDPGMHHVRQALVVMHVGIANPLVAGKTFPAYPAHAQPAIFLTFMRPMGYYPSILPYSLPYSSHYNSFQYRCTGAGRFHLYSCGPFY